MTYWYVRSRRIVVVFDLKIYKNATNLKLSPRFAKMPLWYEVRVASIITSNK